MDPNRLASAVLAPKTLVAAVFDLDAPAGAVRISVLRMACTRLFRACAFTIRSSASVSATLDLRKDNPQVQYERLAEARTNTTVETLLHRFEAGTRGLHGVGSWVCGYWFT